MKYFIHLDIFNKWRWHLNTADGERLATGEVYGSREECEAAINCIRAAGAAAVEVRGEGATSHKPY